MGRGKRRFFIKFTKNFRPPFGAAAFVKRRQKTAKAPIYKDWKLWYFDIGSFPISHPLGPHGICCAAPFFTGKKPPVSRRFRSFPSSPPLAVHAAVQVRHLPLGRGEEALQLVLKGLIPRGRQGLWPAPARKRLGSGSGDRRRPGTGRM